MIQKRATQRPQTISNALIGKISTIVKRSKCGFITSEIEQDDFFFHMSNLHFKTNYDELNINDYVEFYLAESVTENPKPMAVKVRTLDAAEIPVYYYYITFHPTSYDVRNSSHYKKINPFETVFFLGTIKFDKKVICAKGIFEPVYYKEKKALGLDEKSTFEEARKLFAGRIHGKLEMNISRPSIIYMQRLSKEKYDSTLKKYKYYS